MITGTFKLFKMFRSTVKGVDSAKQLAAGTMLGMMIGLLPKDSLFPYALGILILMTTANLFCATFFGFAFSWLGAFLDPFAHWLGARVLTFQPLEATWSWLYQLPMMPWTRFDNTVVMGSLVIGLLLAIPVYVYSLNLYTRYSRQIAERMNQSQFMRWLMGPPMHTLQESS